MALKPHPKGCASRGVRNLANGGYVEKDNKIYGADGATAVDSGSITVPKVMDRGLVKDPYTIPRKKNTKVSM